jgi:hypothetical protein
VTVGAGATQWLVFGTHPGYSYSLDISDALGTTAPSTFTLFRGDDGCSGTSSAVSRDTSAIDPAASGSTARMAFTATGSDPNYRLSLTNPSGAPVVYNFVLGETTLFSPAWSTFGTYNTYYSFQNTTSATINATLTLTRSDGTSAGSTTLAIPPGVTASTNTVALGTIRNATGTTRVTHDGPPGALVPEADIANFSLTPAYVQPVRFRSVRETR